MDTAEQIESALDATGLAWVRREADWVIPASASMSRELHVSPAEEGVRVQAVLVEWDEIGPPGPHSLQALTVFLRRASDCLRCARCGVENNRAVVVSDTTSDDLTDAVRAVTAACRLLARPAAALLVPEVAQMYLDVGCSGVGPEEASRGTVSRSARVGATVVERC